MTQGQRRPGQPPAALSGLRTAYRVRRQLAELFQIPGGAEQAAFTSGATEARNTAIYGLFSPATM